LPYTECRDVFTKYPPFQCNLIGNSDATPLIPKDQIVPPTLAPNSVTTNLQQRRICSDHRTRLVAWYLK